MKIKKDIKTLIGEIILKNFIIFLSSLAFIPHLIIAITDVPADQLGNFHFVLSMLLVCAGFGNYAFTYGSIRKESKGELLIGHITSGLLMLMFGILLVAITVSAYLYYPTAGFITAFISGIMYLSLFTYDIWDTLRMKDVSLKSNLQETKESQFNKTVKTLLSSAERLKSGRSIEIANYYIGMCFEEIYNYLKFYSAFEKSNIDEKMLEMALKLRHNPFLPQKEGDKLGSRLLNTFLNFLVNTNDIRINILHKSIVDEAIKLEVRDENQELADTRFATIFEGIADIMQIMGDDIFPPK